MPVTVCVKGRMGWMYSRLNRLSPQISGTASEISVQKSTVIGTAIEDIAENPQPSSQKEDCMMILKT